MKSSRYADSTESVRRSTEEVRRSKEYSSDYNFSTVRQSSDNQENVLRESMRVSQMFSNGSAQDLPLALRLLDESLQKSNTNVCELKENLMYVL